MTEDLSVSRPAASKIGRPVRPPFAWPALGAVAVTVGAVLVAGSGGYGYHRDELYFLRAGNQLAFGYVDQPPLTPVLARLASEVFGDSLIGLRLASAMAAGLVVLCAGLLAREFGGGRGAQALAGAGMAVCGADAWGPGGRRTAAGLAVTRDALRSAPTGANPK